MTVANAWIPIEAVVAGGEHVEGAAVTAVETLDASHDRRHRAAPATPGHPRARGTDGQPVLDSAYRVVGMARLAEGVVTPEMQQRISARDDWTFIAEDTTVISVCREPFATADEVSQRISDVLAIVAALPASVAPAQVDHSADDLLARIAHIDTIEQALAFLQQLSDADRQRLAASPTPLAKFADVRSPDEAIARMMALPEIERLQLLAMFQKANAG